MFADDAPVHLLKKKTARRRSSAAWIQVGKQKIYARSLWERNFAFYLEWLRNNKSVTSWKHEPRTFWFLKIKRGVRSYKPDFRIVYAGGLVKWIEVKGWLDPRSATKLKRMAKYYPKIDIEVRDAKWFSENGPMLASVVPGWERG